MVAAIDSPPAALPYDTPSKGVATALDKFNIETPIKAKLFKDTELESKKEKEVVVEDDFEANRLRFVGDVDLPESEEPLLKESRRRFVLFPIQYNEVSASLIVLTRHRLTPFVDLDDVQEGSCYCRDLVSATY